MVLPVYASEVEELGVQAEALRGVVYHRPLQAYAREDRPWVSTMLAERMIAAKVDPFTNFNAGMFSGVDAGQRFCTSSALTVAMSQSLARENVTPSPVIVQW